VQRILREQGIKTVQNVTLGGTVPPPGTEDADEDTAEVEVFDEAEEASEPELRVQSREPMPSGEAGGLSREDIRKLESAVHELAECRRLLDDVLKP
jgi:hypothetical protein